VKRERENTVSLRERMRCRSEREYGVVERENTV